MLATNSDNLSTTHHYYVDFYFFFSSRRRHTRCLSDWSSDVCSSDLSCRNRAGNVELLGVAEGQLRDEEDLLEVEPRCDHLLAEGGEIVLVSAADFLE